MTPRLCNSDITRSQNYGGLTDRGADPQAEEVAFAVGVDSHDQVADPVCDVSVEDLDTHPIEDEDRVDHIQGPVLPSLHVVDDLIGDPTDRGTARGLVVHVEQVRGNVSGPQPLRVERDHHLIEARQAALPDRDHLGLERAVTVPGRPCHFVK
ncbi:MAG: hypothetical protein R2735_08870 [Microthrixaceae bacterium]